MTFERIIPLDMATAALGPECDRDGGLTGQIICFAKGTAVATPHGERAIESLKPGDLVITRDHGLQPVRWTGMREVSGMGRQAPVTFDTGSMVGLERPLTVSPRHRMLLRSATAEIYFGEREVLVPAIHLIGRAGIRQIPCERVTYVHLLFDQHEIIYAEGAASESFHPGDAALSGLSDAVREELFNIFPALRSMDRGGGRTARRCLRRHEAMALPVPRGNQPSHWR